MFKPNMRKKKVRQTKEKSGEKKRVDRFLLFLLTCTTLAFALWAVLASLLAYHYRTKSEMAYVNLQDSRAALSDIKSSADTKQQSSRNDLIHAEIIRSELGRLFRQLILPDERPKDVTELMTTFQTLFGEVSGETMSRLDMIALKKTLTEILGVVPASARPAPRIIKERVDIKKASAAMVAEGIIVAADREAVEQALKRLMNGLPPLVPGAPTTTAPPVAERKPPARPAPAAVAEAPAKIVAAPLAPPVVKAEPPPKPTRKEFVDKKHGYRVSFPLDWNMKEDADSATVLARSPRKDFSQLYTAYVIITAKRSEAKPELEHFSTAAMENVEESMGAFEKLESAQVDLAGQPAKRVRLRFERLGKTFESIYIFSVKDKIGYMLSFTVPEEQVEESVDKFEDILGQFKFL